MATRTHPRWKQQTRKKKASIKKAKRKKKTLPKPSLVLSPATLFTPTHTRTQNEHKTNYAVLEIGPRRQTIFLSSCWVFISRCIHLSSAAVKNRPRESDVTYEISLLFVLDVCRENIDGCALLAPDFFNKWDGSMEWCATVCWQHTVCMYVDGETRLLYFTNKLYVDYFGDYAER